MMHGEWLAKNLVAFVVLLSHISKQALSHRVQQSKQKRID
jgi:hypothetical protein